MDERGRLLNVFLNKEIDMIPWFADLSWWYNSNKEDLPEKFKGENGYLELYKETKTGIYVYAPNLWKEVYPEEIKFINEKRGNLIISKIVTPYGNLESIQEYLPSSFTVAYRSHYIKNLDDLKIMQYIFQKRKVIPNYEEFERIDKLWNGYGLPVALGPICVSLLQSLITRWAGIECTINLLIENEKFVEETIEIIQSCDDEIFKIIEEGPCEIVEFPENLSGEITGKNLIEKYEVPYWKKRIKQLKKKNKFVGIHNDGSLKASIFSLISAGFDFIEAVGIYPFCDLKLEEIYNITKDKIIVWGLLPGCIFSLLYKEEFFENFVKEVILFVKDKKNFILGVADQVPPDAPLKRIFKVREMIEKWGKI